MFSGKATSKELKLADRVLKGEYYHLLNRKENLEAVLKLWDGGKLSFTPDCPRSIYDLQLRAMNDYKAVLEARAKIEKVVL